MSIEFTRSVQACLDTPRKTLFVNQGNFELTLPPVGPKVTQNDINRWIASFSPPTEVAEISDAGDGAIRFTWQSTADHIFGEDGPLSKIIDGYEPRAGQVHMARLVSRAIEMRCNLVVEGPTGVGKSLAYALPPLYNGKKIIVSTSNLSLQSQIKRDGPLISQVCGIPEESIAILQGKSNYACKIKVEEVADEIPSNLLDWCESTEDGDLGKIEFPLSTEDRERVNIDDGCPGRNRCEMGDRCHFYKAKDKAFGEDIKLVITNHALLCLSTQLPNLLPADADLIVVDEAHALAHYKTDMLSEHMSLMNMMMVVERLMDWVPDKAEELEEAVTSTYMKLSSWLDGTDPNGFPIGDNVKFQCMYDLAFQISKAIDYLSDESTGSKSEAKKKTKMRNDAKSLMDKLFALYSSDSENFVRVVEYDEKLNPIFYLKCINPSLVDVGVVWDEEENEYRSLPTVYTSATLATPDLSSFVITHGIENEMSASVSSPFNYEENTKLYIPSGHFPTRTAPEFHTEAMKEISDMVEASNGGALILFNSFKDMERVERDMKWTNATWVQGHLEKAEIIKRFQADGNGVILGTRSFFEGVDIPGDALRLVIIYAMPFGARDATTKATEKKVDGYFGVVYLPEAINHLKQAAGRLVRRIQDRGVVAILDNRVLHKTWGARVTGSLPPFKMTSDKNEVLDFLRK